MTATTEASTASSGRVDEDTYRRLWPGLVRLARLLTGSQALAEDLAQEAFLGLLRAGSVQHPEAYLHRAVVNLATNNGRRVRRERLHLASLRDNVVAEPTVDGLWPLVIKLPAQQRAAVVLRYYLDLSEAQAAVAMSCRPGTVKAHLSKALTRLRKDFDAS